MNQFTPLRQRFDASYIPEPNSGCWLWTGAASAVNKSGTDIRPTIRANGKTRRAHRVSYELHHGALPAGSFVCHRCDTPLCVNPDHLYAGSAQTNAADAVARGRHNSQRDLDAARQRGRDLGQRNTWNGPRPDKAIIPTSDYGAIAKQLAQGGALSKVAAGYGVSKQAVAQFLKRAALARARGEPS